MGFYGLETGIGCGFLQKDQEGETVFKNSWVGVLKQKHFFVDARYL